MEVQFCSSVTVIVLSILLYVGVPPNTATATVIISVLDVNDNAPVLNARVYEVTIPEEAVPNEVAMLLAGLNASLVLIPPTYVILCSYKTDCSY